MPTKSGLKSQVVLKQELISIIKQYLVHNKMVLSQRVVSRQDGLSTGVLLYILSKNRNEVHLVSKMFNTTDISKLNV